eukprot:scaffold103350_cov65-Phaeocystis_antarctica.AAC.5
MRASCGAAEERCLEVGVLVVEVGAGRDEFAQACYLAALAAVDDGSATSRCRGIHICTSVNEKLHTSQLILRAGIVQRGAPVALVLHVDQRARL